MANHDETENPPAGYNIIEHIARVCHEANRAHCTAIGDMSQPAWDDAPDWQRQSAIAGVVHALGAADPKPEDSHNSWLAHKKADGWVYGEVKDPQNKTHPCMVPYDALPPEQRVKDSIFLAIVRAIGPHQTWPEGADDAPIHDAIARMESVASEMEAGAAQIRAEISALNINRAES